MTRARLISIAVGVALGWGIAAGGALLWPAAALALLIVAWTLTPDRERIRAITFIAFVPPLVTA